MNNKNKSFLGGRANGGKNKHNGEMLQQIRKVLLKLINQNYGMELHIVGATT